MSIRFVNVSKSFGPRKILQNISFEILKGEILFILGKSGVGKSVTLKQIVGLMKPDEGDIYLDGAPISKLSLEELAVIRSQCGMVFQHPALLDSLNVFENVAFGLGTPQYMKTHPTLLSQEAKKSVVIDKLKRVHLTDSILERFPPEISHGMQKRTSIARTLAPEPSYILFDEPTTGLDPITTRAITDLIFELSRELKITSVVVSHDMACALSIADRILVLDQGEILALGTPEEMRKSKIPLIVDFLSETLFQEDEITQKEVK